MKSLAIGFVILLIGTLISCASSGSVPSEPPSMVVPFTEEPKSTASSTVLLTAPPPDCPHVPLAGFNDVWHNDQVWPRLGCAIAPAEAISGTEAYLRCMHSIWLHDKHIFVAIPYSLRGWSFVPDESGIPTDTPLMVEPVPRSAYDFPATGRHGWLANLPAYVNECDGRSRTGETVFEGQIQQFERGWLLWNGNVCFVLFDDGFWTMF
jgi:hypothetical protein